MYNYFGGVTRVLINDNLKTGVVTNSRYDLVMNKSYQELAEYYDTAIVPCRVEAPNDYLQNQIIFKNEGISCNTAIL